MRRFAVVVVWVLATFSTGLVAWGAVNLAGRQVSNQPVRALSASEVAQLPASTVALTTTDESNEVGVSPPPAVGPQTPAPDAVTSPPTPGSSSVPSSTSTTVPGVGATATTVTMTPPPSTTTTTAPPPTTTTTAATPTTSPAAYSKSYTLKGGRVTIRVDGDRVTLVTATPALGFGVTVEDGGPNEVEVEFESAQAESRFRAEVDDGDLVVEIDED